MAPHGRTMQALNAVLSPIKERSEREIQNYINRALFDPEYAKTLIDAAQGRMGPKVFRETFTRQINNMPQIIKISSYEEGRPEE